MSEIIRDESSLVSPRSRWTPGFLREIEARGNEDGFVEAFHDMLERAHITVNVEGDIDQLQKHDGGILFIGDHKRKWEFIAVAEVLNHMGRSALLNIAKFYVQRRGYMALGHRAATEYVTPVYPRILARDRPNIFNYELMNRLLFKKHLLSFAESEEANARSIAKASQFLVDGGAVNIHPTGSVNDATEHAWRSGVGRIIQEIPDQHKVDTLLVPYSLDEFSQARFLGALATRGSRLFGSQTMELKLGSLQTAEAAVHALPNGEEKTPDAITEYLRKQFLDDFANQ